MLIVRCAWHRRHFGYTSYTGLTRDFRWRVAFSDGICRPCADVMRATAWGTAPKSVSVTRELARAALALTGVAAWLLVMLLFAGCGETASEKSERELNAAAQRIVNSDPRWSRVEVKCYLRSTCYVEGGVATVRDRDDLFGALWSQLPARHFARVENKRVQIYR